MWSIVADPCVLRARIVSGTASASFLFDGRARQARRIADTEGEHIAFDCQGDIARIDLVDGHLPTRPVQLCFDIVADEMLARRIAALRRIYLPSTAQRPPTRLHRQHLSLLAADARAAGMSLREIAERVLGPGDWPGAGEHRKSLARRLVAAGAALCVAGPVAILQSWPVGNL